MKCPHCGNAENNPIVVGKHFIICGKCNKTIPLDKDWVELPETGTLLNYTVTYYKVNDRTTRKVKKPQIIGMIQIDGSNTGIVYRLLNIDPDDIKVGMRVKVVWEEKTKGDPSDIKGFTKL